MLERALTWLSKRRAILIRWDTKAVDYLNLLKLAPPCTGIVAISAFAPEVLLLRRC